MQDINEDAHISTQLGLHGWKRLYVHNKLTYTESKTTLLPWVKQQVRTVLVLCRYTNQMPIHCKIRRKKSNHLEIIANPLYNASSGLLFFWWRAREVLVEQLLFIEIIQYATKGQSSILIRSLPGDIGLQLAISVICLAVYNILRSPEKVGKTGDLLLLPLSIMLQLFTMPFANVWAAVTLFEDSWDTTDRDQSIAQAFGSRALHPTRGRHSTWDPLLAAFIAWAFVLAVFICRVGLIIVSYI